jgi:hypothetical protein
MKLFLASIKSHKKYFDYLAERGIFAPYVLESFYSTDAWAMEYIKNCKMFLLDSGAFSFLKNNSLRVDFDDYLKKYIHFINKHNVKYFFELDIDSVVGLSKVEKYREILERETGKKCIPVWHKSRGKQYFIDMVKEYDYVAVGGIAIKVIKKSEYKYLSWFVRTAHEHGAQIHGLGFSDTKYMELTRFDSVDSTTWSGGGRFGKLYKFDGEKIIITASSQTLTGKRFIKSRGDLHNILEWLKYVNYLERMS